MVKAVNRPYRVEADGSSARGNARLLGADGGVRYSWGARGAGYEGDDVRARGDRTFHCLAGHPRYLDLQGR